MNKPVNLNVPRIVSTLDYILQKPTLAKVTGTISMRTGAGLFLAGYAIRSAGVENEEGE